MSAPDTNTETQAKRHKPSLFGIWGGTGIALAMLVLFVAFNILAGDEPVGADAVVDGRTGEVTEVSD